MLVHNLKCEMGYYDMVASGQKSFELRKDDRGFGVGDILILWRYDGAKGVYTGQSTARRITCILRGGPWLQPGYVALGLERKEAPNSPDIEEARKAVTVPAPVYASKLEEAKALAKKLRKEGKQLHWVLAFVASNPSRDNIYEWFADAPQGRRKAELIEWLASLALEWSVK